MAPAEPSATTEAERPEPSASPTSEADPTDPGLWLIDFDGIGPVTIGGSIADATPALAEFAAAPSDTCPNPAVRLSTMAGGPALIYDLDADNPDTVGSYVSVSAGPLSGFGGTLNDAATPRTAGGIGLGSSLADVNGAYPDAREIEYSEGYVYYVITDGSERYIQFTVIDGIVQWISSQTFPDPLYEICA